MVGGLYRSLGQEATSVGAAFALEPGDVLGPLIQTFRVTEGLIERFGEER
jgi:TPP-dependent pyruvate/acetoin dehydrogenase alpha subunit